MSDILAVGSRSNGSALEFYDKSTGRTLATFGAAVAPIHAAYFTATLAQLNAGFTIAADDANKQFVVVGFTLIATGAFTTLTDVRLSDSSNVDIATFAQAQLTNGAVLMPGSAGVTLGSYGVALTAGKGLVLRKTGSAGAGGTSITVTLLLKHI